MFFYLSKILWLVAAPSNILAGLSLAGALLLLTRRARFGRRLVIASTSLLLAFGILPIGSLLLLPLENRFKTPSEGAPPAGLIVLGGAIDPVVGASRGQVTTDDAAERLTEGAALAIRYPEAKLVFTGGTNALFIKTGTEAADAARLWRSLGISPERIVVEDQSRNSYENAVFTRDLVKPKPGDRWLLVTSAYHMPRSIGLFRKAGFPVIAFPVDYRTEGRWTNLKPALTASGGLHQLDLAVREWIGLVAYYLTGKTESLLPGP